MSTKRYSFNIPNHLIPPLFTTLIKARPPEAITHQFNFRTPQLVNPQPPAQRKTLFENASAISPPENRGLAHNSPARKPISARPQREKFNQAREAGARKKCGQAEEPRARPGLLTRARTLSHPHAPVTRRAARVTPAGGGQKWQIARAEAPRGRVDRPARDSRRINAIELIIS